MTSALGRRKLRVGRVVGDKMDKTVVVAVERRQLHGKYGKTSRRSTKFKAHDEHNEYRTGDMVRIVEVRPLSKSKRWRVLEVLSRREVPEVAPTEAMGPEVEELRPVPAAPVEAEAEAVAEVEAEVVEEAEPEVEAVAEVEAEVVEEGEVEETEGAEDEGPKKKEKR